MKIKTIFAAAGTFLTAANLFAGVINFENAPITGLDLGGYYNGITFGAGEQVLAATTSFPAVSGTHILGDFGPTLSFTFNTAQQNVSFYYTSLNGFSGVAFDGSLQVDTFTGTAGTGKTTKVTLSDSTADITKIVLTDDGNPTVPEVTTIDNVSAGGVTEVLRGAPLNAPDATSTAALFALAGLGLVAFRRKFAAQQ